VQNTSTKVTGNKLVITIDLKAKATPSASGKTMVIASTRGNQPIPFGDEVLHLGLNLYRKK